MHRKDRLKKQSGFTLAELLVGLAIIGIMFLMALPALTGLSRASKLDSAATAMQSAIKLARQYAITHGQPAYLIFHDDQSTTNESLSFRSYAVFTINIHTNIINQSAGMFITNWERLPTGIVFDKDYSESNENIFSPPSAAWKAGFGRNRQLRIQSVIYPVLGFRPQGTLRGGQYHDINLIEGFYRDGELMRISQQGARIRVNSLGQSQRTTFTVNEKIAIQEQPQ